MKKYPSTTSSQGGSAVRLARKSSVSGLKHQNSLAEHLNGSMSATSKASGVVQGSPPGSAMKNFSKKLVKHPTSSPSPTKKKLLKKESTIGTNNDLKMV